MTRKIREAPNPDWSKFRIAAVDAEGVHCIAYHEQAGGGGGCVDEAVFRSMLGAPQVGSQFRVEKLDAEPWVRWHRVPAGPTTTLTGNAVTGYNF